MGYVNCYLIEMGTYFILIDTGGSTNRKDLTAELVASGCRPGLLRLVILTHGDFDHTGNAAYLRSTFGCKIAMHKGDSGMVETADMFFNRNKPNVIIRKLIPFFTGFGSSEIFSPDILFDDEDNLSGFGFDASIIAIPGHSKGSIGILTNNADLFCGDLLENIKSPGLNSIMDNLAEAGVSLDKLGKLQINQVYPGHGNPFRMEEIKT